RADGAEVRGHIDAGTADIWIAAAVAADDAAIQDDGRPRASINSATGTRTLIRCDGAVADSDAGAASTVEKDPAATVGRVARQRAILNHQAATRGETDCTTVISRIAGESAVPHRETAAGADVNAATVISEAVDRVANDGAPGQCQ